MPKGTVKFFNESKGFGFITNEDSGRDIFVHVSGLLDDLREGDKVEYDEAEGRKGMNAVNVRVL
ncbi:MAG: cold-shock protein [Saprospiraceae bacterium]